MAVNVKWLVLDLLCITYFCVTPGNNQNITTSPVVPTTILTTSAPAPSTTTIPVPRNTDIGPCTCDLTARSCDVNCCCDTECSNEDIQAFSQCDDTATRPNDQTCVREDLIFRSNIHYKVNTTVPGLFCIERDNYQQRNYYSVPDVANTTEKLDEYRRIYGRTSFKPENRGIDLNTGIYRSGDPIYTIFESNSLGVLGLARRVFSRQCSDDNPAAFLYNQEFECTRIVTDISTCESNAALNAETYYKNFQVLKSPQILQEFEVPSTNNTEIYYTTTVEPTTATVTVTVDPTAPSTSLYNSSYVVPVDPILPAYCIDNTNLNQTCNITDRVPTPVYTSSSCQYVVVETQYEVYHNTSGGITAVNVRFTLMTITSDTVPFTQTFKTTFFKEGETDAFKRSGNPGYVVGQPIMAGKLVSIDTDNGRFQAIQLNSDRNNWLTMVTSSARGECITEPQNRVPVNFGEAMRSGCNIRIKLENMTSESRCNLIQAAADNALYGDVTDLYVATFGNSAVEKTGDWIPVIIQGKPDSARNPQTGRCSEISLGMHIEIVYANVGSLGNPQPKILGVSFRYEPKQEIAFQCTGQYCQPGQDGLEQTIEVVSSVGFVDATKSAIDVVGQPPRFAARLPEDFFYPFSRGNIYISPFSQVTYTVLFCLLSLILK